jgi:hypothetical protein
MPVATVPGVLVARGLGELVWGQGSSVLSEIPPVPLGLAVGFAYVLAELPNSYLKRRLGVPPGASPEHGRLWFRLCDQIDSVIGCGLIYAWLLDVPMVVLAVCALLAPAIHLVTNLSLHAVGLRREAF